MESTVRRTIPVPLGSMRLNEYWPIIRHYHFARLFHRRQLGTAFIAFPGARHSRGEHALGVARRTQNRAWQWRDRGLLEDARIPELIAAALLHDIGHGPFSHLIETVTRENHKSVGTRRILEMSDALTASGIDPQRVNTLLSGEDPLGAIVTDRNLGTDKLSYLSVDAYHAGLEWQQSFETIEAATLPVNGRIGVDIKTIDGVKHLQRLYMMLYKNFYLVKSATIAEQVVREMVRRLVELGLEEDELWNMIDGELEGLFFRSGDPAVREMARWYKDLRFPKTAVVLRFADAVAAERIAGKPIAVRPAPTPVMHWFSSRDFHASVASFQESVARVLGLPTHHVVVVPPPERKRFIPEDIPIWDTSGVVQLSSIDPDHFASLARDYQASAAVRICVPEERRMEVSKKADQVAETMIRLASALA